jgi:hypothetical protein
VEAVVSIAALVGLFLLLGGEPTASHALALPDQLKEYRSWRTVASQPFPVPYELWIQCVHPSREQEAKAAREHGPHAQLEVQVFTNPVASANFYSSVPGAFPAGAIVVKEKLAGGTSAPVALAAMIKGAPGSHPTSGDWEFLYVTSEGPIVATAACVDCHRAAPTDFLFRTYPKGLPK